MPSRPTCARLFKTGGKLKGSRKIRCTRSARAVTSNASPESARPGTPRRCLPMPDNGATKAYLALDFGAESGRAILARLHSGVLVTEEIRRFKNEPPRTDGGFN